MHKKIVLAILALFSLALAFVILEDRVKEDPSLKVIHLNIKTSEKTLLDDSFDTKASSLADLLYELKDKGVLLMESEESNFGFYIKALGKDELYFEDAIRGLYWVYASENNKDCLKQSFCPVANEIALKDGDRFEFSLIEYAS